MIGVQDNLKVLLKLDEATYSFISHNQCWGILNFRCNASLTLVVLVEKADIAYDAIEVNNGNLLRLMSPSSAELYPLTIELATNLICERAQEQMVDHFGKTAYLC